MTWSKIRGYLTSIALASAIAFGYGYHPTVDAIIVTVVWIFLPLSALSMILLTIMLVVVRSDNKLRSDPDAGKFYKGLRDLHSNVAGQIISYMIVGYWLYALIIQEWTATAVFYVMVIIYTKVFSYMTKDLVKDFFLEQLKGEGKGKLAS